MRPIAHPKPLGWKAESKETMRLAGPLALANLLQMLTYSVDIIFIARLGSDELAAAALGVSVFGLLIWAMHGLTGAVAPLIAAELGARAPALRPIRRSMRMALWLSVLSGCIAMVLCLGTVPLMRITGQESQITEFGGDYSNILLFSSIPMVMASVLRNFVSTLGRPIFATIIIALGIVVNALANYAFIFGNWGAPEMGLQGAAIATFMTSLSVVALYVIVIRLDPRLHRYHIFGYFWRPDWGRMKEIVRLGTPIALTIVAEAGIFGAAAFLMGRIGSVQLAAHTLALQTVALAFQIPFGVGQAATIRVGYFYGAGEKEGVRQAGWTAFVIGLGFILIGALAMLLAPQYLLAVYIDAWDPANAAIVGFATSFLLIGAAFQLSDSVQAIAAGALRGLQDTRTPMWIALFSYWVPGFGIAFGLGFGTKMAGLGIWIGLAVGLTCAAVLLLWRWHSRERLGLVRS